MRQPGLDALKQSHPPLRFQDFLVNAISTIVLRTDKPPFNDVRGRRAISQAIDRQAIIAAVYMRGEPSRRFHVAWPSGRCPLTSSAWLGTR